MRRTHLLMLTAVLVFATACSDGAGTTVTVAEGESASGVTVVGTGEVEGRPDTLRATVGIELTEDDVSTALANGNERAQAVIDAVKEAGVADDDVQTSQFSIRPQYDHRRDERVLEGYQVRNSIRITIRDLDSAGQVLTAAAEAGGNAARISNLGFSLDDNTELLEQARERAFQDARAKAEQYAALAGTDLAAVISVEESVDRSGPTFEGSYRALEEAAADVPIEAGTQQVAVHVTVRWDLES